MLDATSAFMDSNIAKTQEAYLDSQHHLKIVILLYVIATPTHTKAHTSSMTNTATIYGAAAINVSAAPAQMQAYANVIIKVMRLDYCYFAIEHCLMLLKCINSIVLHVCDCISEMDYT